MLYFMHILLKFLEPGHWSRLIVIFFKLRNFVMMMPLVAALHYLPALLKDGFQSHHFFLQHVVNMPNLVLFGECGLQSLFFRVLKIITRNKFHLVAMSWVSFLLSSSTACCWYRSSLSMTVMYLQVTDFHQGYLIWL